MSPGACRCAPLTELHRLERHLNERSVDELIRLIRSEHFAAVTEWHIRMVGEYCPIELAGERYFACAFSTGKEAAWGLALARQMGRSVALRDLECLRASMTGTPARDG